MIDRNAATKIAAELLGRPHNDGDHPWALEEFTEGWLIQEELEGIGSATKVIEKNTGTIRFFPSYISPDLVVEEYASVLDTSQVVSTRQIES